MPAAIAAHTRDPLPPGAPTAMRVGRCPTCRQTRMESPTRNSIGTPWTRSTNPVRGDQYEMWPHEMWCPVWTGETPEVACPVPGCGAPVIDFTYRPGYTARVPWTAPYGNPGTLVGTMDEISDRLTSEPDAKITDEPSFDKADLQPCGHTVEGSQAHEVRRLYSEAVFRRKRQQDEATIAASADLLAAAEAAGHGVLVEQYKTAVYDRSGDRQGLLAALRTLAGQG